MTIFSSSIDEFPRFKTLDPGHLSLRQNGNSLMRYVVIIMTLIVMILVLILIYRPDVGLNMLCDHFYFISSYFHRQSQETSRHRDEDVRS